MNNDKLACKIGKYSSHHTRQVTSLELTKISGLFSCMASELRPIKILQYQLVFQKP